MEWLHSGGKIRTRVFIQAEGTPSPAFSSRQSMGWQSPPPPPGSFRTAVVRTLSQLLCPFPTPFLRKHRGGCLELLPVTKGVLAQGRLVLGVKVLAGKGECPPLSLEGALGPPLLSSHSSLGRGGTQPLTPISPPPLSPPMSLCPHKRGACAREERGYQLPSLPEPPPPQRSRGVPTPSPPDPPPQRLVLPMLRSLGVVLLLAGAPHDTPQRHPNATCRPSPGKLAPSLFFLIC